MAADDKRIFDRGIDQIDSDIKVSADNIAEFRNNEKAYAKIRERRDLFNRKAIVSAMNLRKILGRKRYLLKRDDSREQEGEIDLCVIFRGNWKIPTRSLRRSLLRWRSGLALGMPEDMRQFYLQHNGGILPPGAKIDPERCKLTDFLAIKYLLMESIPIMDTLLEWQKMDGFISMYYIPFCNDEAGDSYYIRVDEEGYGKVYYVFGGFLDDFLADSEGEGLTAGSFTEFLEMIRFSHLYLSYLPYSAL